jgi:hypothetical protein
MSSSSLRSALDELANQFANSVLTAIRTASLEELLAESGGGTRGRRNGGSIARGGEAPARGRRGKASRLARRTPEQVKAALDKVVSAIKASKGKGLRSEQIQAALKLDKRELPRVIAMGLQARRLRRKGQKRATVYFAK